MRKQKVKRFLFCYGSIIKIENNKNIIANIYDHNTHDFIDQIFFCVTEFPEWQRKDLFENSRFTLSVGEIGNAPYVNFRLWYN